MSPTAASAQEADPAQRAFIERYVAALRSGDLAALKAVVHPASIVCMDTDNRDYFDFIFAKELGYGKKLAAGYTIQRVAPLSSDQIAGPMADLFPYPVPPSHEFQIDTGFDGNNSSLSLIRTIAPLNGSWYEVMACPTAKGLAVVRERRAEGEQQKARATEFASGLQEPLLSELKALLAQHQRVAAIKRLAAEAGIDLTMATEVVNILEAK